MKITDKQVSDAKTILRLKEEEDRLRHDEESKARVKMYKDTFWRGLTTGYADKDGVHIMKALRDDGYGRTIFEVWQYAHDGVYGISQQENYELHPEMKQITELEFYTEARRFLFKIKATEVLEE